MTAVKAPWVKWYAEDFLAGVIDLEAEEIGVYAVILNMIYAKGCPILNDPKMIGRRVNLRPSSVAKIIIRLEKLGKLIRADDVISNPRAEKELETRAKVVQKLKENLSSARESLNNKSNENKGLNPPDGAGNEAPKGTVELDSELELERKSRKRAPPPRPPAAPARQTRIDPQLKLPESWRLYARSKGLTDRETKFNFEKFVAHYRHVSGQKGLSMDWEASWQSWVLGSVDRLGRDPAPAQGDDAPIDPKTYTAEDWGRIIKLWKATSHWHPGNGPPPGQRNCLVPTGLLDNHG